MEATANTTDIFDSPAAVRAAAHAYNAGYPEAAAEIETGRPVLDVAAIWAGKYGSRVRLIATFGIVTPDGGFIASEEPRVVYVKTRGTTTTRETYARRMFRLEASCAGVELRTRLVGL